jgi:hypothetical protein
MPEKTIIESAAALAPIVAGAAIAAGLQARDSAEKSALKKVVNGFIDTAIGATTAYYLAGAAAEYFSQTSTQSIAAIGFLFGAMGTQLVRWALKDGVPALLKRFGVTS